MEDGIQQAKALDTVQSFLSEFPPFTEVASVHAVVSSSPEVPSVLNMKGNTDITHVAAFFDRPINEAAKALAICPTVLKKICRKHGLKRWPSRRLKSIKKQIALLKTVIQDGCADGDQTTLREISEQIELLEIEKGKICFQIDSCE